ncbi:hypothetical protein DFJ63DRAFT_311746 [Scheffersomyces coipomensis]|uniref:uncharacterized protein n=1 Tax=Scheffersomyces coipomensis TaxID=1788519 RepID=UPI00315C9182
MKGQNPNRSNSQKNGHRRSNSRVSNSSISPSSTNGSGITASATNGNGNGNGNSIPQSNSNQSLNVDDQAGNDRLLYLISKSIGKKVIATLTNGSRYQGLLLNGDLSANGESALSVVLNKPVLISKSLIDEKSNIDNINDIPDKLIIKSGDLIDIEIKDLNDNQSFHKKSTPTPTATPTPTPTPTSTSTSTPTNNNTTNSDELSSSSKFRTDADISGRLNLRERELERWVPDEDISHNPSLSLTSDDINHKSGSWDQFKVNEEKFGVESTYDEHLYTTRIDKSAHDYHEKVKKAEQIAREIEGQSTTNSHILEERGIQVDDSGVDEEDKYSGVDRRGDELMAALRNTSISNESVNTSAATTASLFNKSSSSISGPDKYLPPRQRAAHYHNDPAIISSSATNKVVKGASPGPIGSPVPGIENNPIQTPPPSTTVDQSHEQAKSSAKSTAKPVSIPPKPQVPTPQHPNEAFRLNAQSEINSLKDFSANFKVRHKMPTDLLPILAKDKAKQDEILQKQAEVAQNQKKEKEEQQVQASTNSTTTTTPAPVADAAPKKKMDPTKPPFKLNPKAAVFTPSAKHNTQISPPPQKVVYHRSPNGPSPRMVNSRAYSTSNGSSGGIPGLKRYHQISPADFFGGVNKIPTKESQQTKEKNFQVYFNLFVTTKKKYEEKKASEESDESSSGKPQPPIFYEKAFQTPPTWDSTVDDTYDKLFPPPNAFNKSSLPPNMGVPSNAGSQFMPSPMMGNPGIIPTGYPSPVNSKYPLSAQQQQQQQQQVAMAQFQQQIQQQQLQQQQQQYLMYQQPYMAPGQMPMLYPGADPTFLPPGSFMPPPGGYVSGGSPVNGNLILNPNYNPNNNNGGGHYNNHHHSSGRRYSKRGGHNN